METVAKDLVCEVTRSPPPKKMEYFKNLVLIKIGVTKKKKKKNLPFKKQLNKICFFGNFVLWMAFSCTYEGPICFAVNSAVKIAYCSYIY